jgi:hypothetical protein
VKVITLAIPETAAENLAELARRQYRAPRQQAAVMLVAAIEKAVTTPPGRRPGGQREAAPR